MWVSFNCGHDDVLDARKVQGSVFGVWLRAAPGKNKCQRKLLTTPVIFLGVESDVVTGTFPHNSRRLTLYCTAAGTAVEGSVEQVKRQPWSGEEILERR